MDKLWFLLNYKLNTPFGLGEIEKVYDEITERMPFISDDKRKILMDSILIQGLKLDYILNEIYHETEKYLNK